MQMLNGCATDERAQRLVADRRSSRRFSANHAQGYQLALDLQNHFSYCFAPAKGIAVQAPSNAVSGLWKIQDDDY
jgi:hypothetical protein